MYGLYSHGTNTEQLHWTLSLNYFRPVPIRNMLAAWYIPESAAGGSYMELPKLDNEESKKRVDAWESALSENGYSDIKVVAGAEYTFTLNPKGRPLVQ
jgi:hypothetical protein